MKHIPAHESMVHHTPQHSNGYLTTSKPQNIYLQKIRFSFTLVSITLFFYTLFLMGLTNHILCMNPRELITPEPDENRINTSPILPQETTQLRGAMQPQAEAPFFPEFTSHPDLFLHMVRYLDWDSFMHIKKSCKTMYALFDLPKNIELYTYPKIYFKLIDLVCNNHPKQITDELSGALYWANRCLTSDAISISLKGKIYALAAMLLPTTQHPPRHPCPLLELETCFYPHPIPLEEILQNMVLALGDIQIKKKLKNLISISPKEYTNPYAILIHQAINETNLKKARANLSLNSDQSLLYSHKFFHFYAALCWKYKKPH